jgi:prepilin-type N-terminal cleavage/methylation domain-containing protein
MVSPNVILRRGMTLVELLVVIVILGLLGVAAAPAINTSNSKNKLREAAATVSSHILRGASQAVGSRTGSGVWLQASGTATTSPTTLLRFCAGTVEASGTAVLTISNATAATALASLTPSYTALTGTTEVPSGTLIRLSGMPFDYTLLDQTTLGLGGPSTICSWPRTATGYSGTVNALFSLQIPPMRTSGGKTVLGGNVCIDLPNSTIGVYGYSSTATRLSNSSPLILTFDSVGRVKTVICTLQGASTPQQFRLDARTPVALFIGLRDQVGQSAVEIPTEDSPGDNLQRKDGWWVVIDPRTSTVLPVENAPNTWNGALPSRLQESQLFIRKTLLNKKSAI